MTKTEVLDLREIEVLAKKHFDIDLSVRDGKIAAMEPSQIAMLKLEPKSEELKKLLPLPDGIPRSPILKDVVVDNMYSVEYLGDLFAFLKKIGATHVRFIMKDTAPIAVTFNFDCESSSIGLGATGTSTVAMVGYYYLAPRVENAVDEMRSGLPDGFTPCESLSQFYEAFKKKPEEVKPDIKPQVRLEETTPVISRKGKKGRK